MRVEGFTREVPHFMALADYFIGKPGPGSISEALAMQLPVVVERNAWTLAHERYNADWVLEQGVGIVMRQLFRTGLRGRQLLDPARYQGYRERVGAWEFRRIRDSRNAGRDLPPQRPCGQIALACRGAARRRKRAVAGVVASHRL